MGEVPAPLPPLMPESPRTGGDELSAHVANADADDEDGDLFAPEPPSVIASQEARLLPHDPPHRRALSDFDMPDPAPASTHGLALGTAAAAGAVHAERKGWFGRTKASAGQERIEPDLLTSISTSPSVEPKPEPDLLADISATPVVPAPPKAEGRGWFRSRKTSEVGLSGSEQQHAGTAQPARKAREANADPFAAMKATIAPRGKGERKGWFGSRRMTEPAPEAAQPDMVDLEPVRAALATAALRRSEMPDDSMASSTGYGEEAFAVDPADAAQVGVLLVNTGAPDAPTVKAMRRYVREVFSDRRVVEKDTFMWQLRLRGGILPFRSRRRARAYRSIWNREDNEAPLKTIMRSQAEMLGEALAGAGSSVIVDWAMRYGNPSIESRMKGLIAQGCERIVLAPLYPQYSGTTTATACDEAFRVLMHLRNQPALRVAPPYYANPVYIEAIASSIRSELDRLSFEPEVILASYQGIPKDHADKGDPYERQCARTTELLRERLDMDEANFMGTFQSHSGSGEWLGPGTDETLRKLAKQGVRDVAVVTPGFAADCLETLEEVAIENARLFKKRGGKNFAFIPCLNDSEDGMRVIRAIVVRELIGWA